MLDEINYQIPGQYFKKQKKILNSDNIERKREREREYKSEILTVCRGERENDTHRWTGQLDSA